MNSPDLVAQWIWCGGEERPRNFYLYVRKTFLLPHDILRATVRITADSRYQLFCNGALVARGPARCDRRWQCLDQWEITEQVRPGNNVLAVLVHHYGEWTFSYMLGRGGFLAEIAVELRDGSTLLWGSDPSWRVLPATAWEQSLPRMSIQLGFPEVYDARREPTRWNQPGYDDGQWVPATVLGRPGMEPWPRLVPRDIPAMKELPLSPLRVIETGEVGSTRTGHYVDLLRVIWSPSHGVAYLATFVWSREELRAAIHAGSQEALRLWINGQLLISNCVTRDPAPDQEIVSAQLHGGWNTVLAKIIQGEGQWHFYFRIEGEGSDHLVYAPSPVQDPTQSDQRSPWSIIGPFASDGVKEGFETLYPPEGEIDLSMTCRGREGKDVCWISAGVTIESALTAIVMSREPRFPGRGTAFQNVAGLITPGAPAIVHPGAEHGAYAVIDFGKEVTGHPVIELDGALGGEIIDLGYAEVLQSPEGTVLAPARGTGGLVNPDRAGVHYADRYICRPGKQQFQTFDKRAFRYLQVDVRNLHQPIPLGPISLVLSTYPVEARGSFTCSDDLLNRIWEIGAWTVQLNMEDAYTDCPWRERGQWWGDARVQALVNYYAFGDLKLIRRGLRQIAQSQTAEGWTMGVYPTDWSGAILPTFTLLWVISLLDYYMHSGDRELVRELFPAVERAIAAFARHHSEHGLLRNVPHWPFVDWAAVETSGESASLNALYHGALRAAADLADILGDRHQSTGYRGLADDIRSGMERHLWDPEKSCYRESWKEGGWSRNISEQANSWAIVFDVAGNHRASIIESLFDHHRATISTGTPYFSFYVLQAMARAGRHEEVLAYIRSHWKVMLDWGATAWWEVWEPKGSFCHGWSSGPTVVLQTEILGVTPGKPGWEEVFVAPHPGDLAWARGKVPTPHGTISVEWTTGFALLIETPVPAVVRLPSTSPEIITAPPEAERVESDDGQVVYRLRKGGLFHFRSR
jgi:hypothetical protein